MKYFVVLLALMLWGCSDPDPNAPKPQIQTRTEFEYDGCQIKYIRHPQLPDFYIARCGATETVSHQRRVGKTQQTAATINANSEQELRQRLAEIEARNKALAKLSDAEKKALGL